jgi:hypothetical protein
VAPEHCAKFSHNSQTQTGSAVLQAGIRLCLGERFKYPRLLCLGHTDAGVSNRDD